ncbi:MAG TPA: ABC transporter substrate-binding protein [Rubrobacteraceae bacterium]|nr:ABC transporter substrate-binding protein [Rubrobacteraceae bacterium]
MISRREAAVLAGRRMNRRDFLKLGGAGLAGAALLGASGCGGGGASSGELIWSMNTPIPQYNDLVDKFNKQNKGEIQATLRVMPSATDQYFDKLKTEFQAGGGDIDVIGGDVIWPIQYAAQGWLMDLSDSFPESEQQKYLPAPLQANTYEGKIYGIPWFIDAGMFYYRKDLLEQAGFSAPPKTWDELKEMALKTKQDTGTPNGFVFQGSNYEGGVCDACEFIWTHGGDVLSNVTSGEIVIDSPEAVAGLETYRSMIADGVAPQAVTTWTETESGQNFRNGDAVFLREWPGQLGLIADPEQSKIKPEQVGVAAIPTAPGKHSYSALGGWQMLINAQTDMQEEALKFAEFMTASEQEKELALSGARQPTIKSLYDDPELQEANPIIKLAKEVLIENAKSRPVTPYYGDMSLEMAEQFNNVLKGEASPQQGAETLQKSLSSIMEQAE